MTTIKEQVLEELKPYFKESYTPLNKAHFIMCSQTIDLTLSKAKEEIEKIFVEKILTDTETPYYSIYLKDKRRLLSKFKDGGGE